MSADSKGAVCPAPWVLCPLPSFTSSLLLFLRTMGCRVLLGCEIFLGCILSMGEKQAPCESFHAPVIGMPQVTCESALFLILHQGIIALTSNFSKFVYYVRGADLPSLRTANSAWNTSTHTLSFSYPGQKKVSGTSTCSRGMS